MSSPPCEGACSRNGQVLCTLPLHRCPDAPIRQGPSLRMEGAPRILQSSSVMTRQSIFNLITTPARREHSQFSRCMSPSTSSPFSLHPTPGYCRAPHVRVILTQVFGGDPKHRSCRRSLSAAWRTGLDHKGKAAGAELRLGNGGTRSWPNPRRIMSEPSSLGYLPFALVNDSDV